MKGLEVPILLVIVGYLASWQYFKNKKALLLSKRFDVNLRFVMVVTLLIGIAVSWGWLEFHEPISFTVMIFVGFLGGAFFYPLYVELMNDYFPEPEPEEPLATVLVAEEPKPTAEEELEKILRKNREHS